MRKFHQNREAIYPFDEWKIVETKFEPRFNHRSESIFSLGNGYMGMRGTLEEGIPGDVQSTPGIYINGIYETEPIIYGEFMACQPQEYQSMINITDWRSLRVSVENEEFSLFQGTVRDYARTLDLKQGVLTRKLIWTSPQGRQLRIVFERFISQSNQHLALMRCAVTPLNFSGTITIRSSVNGDVNNFHHLRDKALQVLSTTCTNEGGAVISETKNSGFTIGCGVTHRTYPKVPIMGSATTTSLEFIAKFQGKPDQTLFFHKFIAVSTSRETHPQKLQSFVLDLAEERAEQGWEKNKQAHINVLAKYWEDTDIQIEGDPALQQGFRFNALQLLQSTGRDGKTNIAAKGLTGEYYEGHYFWDTETYIIPFFLYSQPELVRKLLEYRYSILDPARQNARRMRNKGALFAWRTINGHEASGNFLGSTVQYHINAAVAYAIHKYVEATDDFDFLAEKGAEILFETARCWADRGVFLESRGGRYCINEVCGPDEYKPGVNNNCYTNYMAQFNLYLALKAGHILKERFPEQYKLLVDKLDLNEEEFKQWEKCADLMYLPFDPELGIFPQDDSFLDKDPIDIDSIPYEDIPLVANWHPLVIWRYQVIKQADVILLLFLLGDQFTLEEKKANFDFYEPRTTHDSSLSPAIYSIIASEVGYYDYAYNYFMQTARLDLDDYNKNVWQGIHTACMAGSWMCVVNGFAGVRTYGGKLWFKPYLPDKWSRYSFKIKFRGCQVKVVVEKETTSYTLLVGDTLEIMHNEQPVTLTQGHTQTRGNHE
ncbi:MAG: glycoside hydrolase family 65 protein [Firmicutes bacterium]|nr:glycoside hydrolase family 65 protein [Bacillota bacterium]